MASPSPTAHSEPRGPFLGVQAINIYVRDLDLSQRFYVDKLGFSVISDVVIQTGQRRIGVAPPDGNTVLTLIAPEPDSEEYKLIGRSTQVIFVTEDVPALYTVWRSRGVRFGHSPRLRRVKYRQQAAARLAEQSVLFPERQPVWGGVFTRFEDLDRNSFGLISLDEVSLAIEAQRQAAAEKLEAERRSAHELEIAKQVQLRLFPQTLPAVKTLEYAGVCIQARQVGGDYYDFLSLGHDRLGLVLGDISGKGIAAALLMANFQANLRTQYAMAADEPSRFLQSVNQLFYDNTADNAYASLFFGEYDDRTRCLRYANCGHLSALLLRAGGDLERLESTCTVLGLFKDWTCSMAECGLFGGDTLVLYTDGVTESFNNDGDEFGEERLIDILHRRQDVRPQALLDAIVDEVRHFSPHEQHDDVTLIVAKGRS